MKSMIERNPSKYYYIRNNKINSIDHRVNLSVNCDCYEYVLSGKLYYDCMVYIILSRILAR